MRRIATTLAVVLSIIFISGHLYVGYKYIFPKISMAQSNRLHMNTGNTTRIMADSTDKMQIQISDILYPAIDDISNSNGYIVIETDKWQDVLSILPIVHKYKSPILIINKQNAQKIIEYLLLKWPNGISQLDGTQLMAFSDNIDSLKNTLGGVGLKTKYYKYSNTNELQRIIYSLPELLNYRYGFLVSDETPLMSIPISTWIVNQGGILLFADSNNNLYDSSKNLITKSDISKIYVLGERSLNSSIENFNIPIETISETTPEKLTIKFAQYYDKYNGVGWNAERYRNDSGHNYILTSKDNPLYAVIASQLSLKGKAGPLLWTDGKKLSSSIENYLWRMKPNFWVTPAEGPYNHIWIIGDEKLISYPLQARADYTQEIAPYETLGEQATSGLDVLSIISILASLLGGLWVGIHAFIRMKNMFILKKIMWILSALLLGPIGIWLYIVSYKTYPWMMMNNDVIWKRPLWNQVAVATMIGVAFGEVTMIAIEYLISLRGLIVIPFSAHFGLYLLGNQMITQMIIVYVVAFILSSFVFIPTILMRMRKISYSEGVKNSLLTVFISMTSVSIGMMTSMYWLHMVYSPMMPEQEHILWWGFAQLATLIGTLVAYIPNWYLVRYGRKMGMS